MGEGSKLQMLKLQKAKPNHSFFTGQKYEKPQLPLRNEYQIRLFLPKVHNYIMKSTVLNTIVLMKKRKLQVNLFAFWC